MHHPTDRMTHTTAFVTPIVEHWLEQEIAQWVHSMKDRSLNTLVTLPSLILTIIKKLFNDTLNTLLINVLSVSEIFL